jgi:hypothetical protein
LAVTTYHYDTLRTGWNSNETTLTPQYVNATTFGILKTVTLDDQVDAQPLIVPSQTIAGSTHDVVYVATESNTIYAIDASRGAKLFARNLGSPVPAPFGCGNNGPDVGITSTPDIDLTSQHNTSLCGKTAMSSGARRVPPAGGKLSFETSIPTTVVHKRARQLSGSAAQATVRVRWPFGNSSRIKGI